MRILPDGTVEIKRKKSGETKIVKPEELPSYGIPYSEYVKEAEAYQKIPDVEPVLSPEKSQKDIDAETAKADINNRADAVLNVIEMGRNGKLSGKSLEDALNQAASKFNAAVGFGEGGKQLTGPELAVLAGSLVKFEQPRTQNFIQHITGEVPSPTGKLLDDADTIERKMKLALGQDISQSNTKEQTRLSSKPTGGQDLLTQLFSAPFEKSPESKGQGIGGFVTNAYQDVKQNVKDLAGLGNIIPVLADILEGRRSGTDTLKQVGEGIGKTYEEIGKYPLDTLYNKPLSTLLNGLAVLPIAKAAGVGKATKEVGAVSTISTDPGLDRILGKAGKVTASKSGSTATRIYENILNVAKKDRAFEKLKPAETSADMVKYGITGGNLGELSTKTQKITGSNGILSNVVNEAVLGVKKPVDMSPVLSIVSESKNSGRFSALTVDKMDEVSKRLNKFIGTGGKKIGDIVEITRLLEEERKLQSEAVEHFIAGSKGDTAAKELGTFKMDVANEMSDIIDKAVKGSGGIDKFKDPKIIDAISEVSPKLAQEFKNAKNVSDIRSLQKPFVRFSKLLDISINQPASASNRTLGRISNIPGVGPILDAAAQNVTVPLSTNTAVALDRLPPNLKNYITAYGLINRNTSGLAGRQLRDTNNPYQF